MVIALHAAEHDLTIDESHWAAVLELAEALGWSSSGPNPPLVRAANGDAVYPRSADLTAADARRLAATLYDAARVKLPDEHGYYRSFAQMTRPYSYFVDPAARQALADLVAFLRAARRSRVAVTRA